MFEEKKKLFQEKFDDLLLFEYFSDVKIVTDVFNYVTDILCQNLPIVSVKYVYPDYDVIESIGFDFNCGFDLKVIVPVYRNDVWRIKIIDSEYKVDDEDIVEFLLKLF